MQRAGLGGALCCGRRGLTTKGRDGLARKPRQLRGGLAEWRVRMIAGVGRNNHAVGDIPGVRFKVVKVSGVALLALYREKKEKPRS